MPTPSFGMVLICGENTHLPEVWEESKIRCNEKCFIRTGSYKKYMLPIAHEGAVLFLSSSYFSNQMPYETTPNNCKGLVDILWKSPDWIKSIFGKKTVAKYNIHSFFFQLIATKIISFQWVGSNHDTCILTCDNNDKYIYNNAVSCEGSIFRSKEWGRSTETILSLLHMP